MSKLNVQRFAIEGPALITPIRHGDHRGWFAETWSAADWTAAGLPDVTWLQDNEAFSAAPATLRGLHFQAPPHAQAKLIRCIQGAIFDAIVDIRKASPTYGQSIGVTLTADGGEQLYVPEGFAHGYQTLTADTCVTYKVNAPYAPKSEGGLFWADTKAAIDWPKTKDLVIADRDAAMPTLDKLDSPF
jgi:dTDP-4-dehydrorhamnose 3,5-epimerase